MAKSDLTKDTDTFNKAKTVSKPPSLAKLIWKEICHDKFAFVSFWLFVLILATVTIGSIILSQQETSKVALGLINKAPSAKHILGTDASGRDMVGQLFLGARNSFLIAFGVTILCEIVGVIVGLVAGFSGGVVDNIIMRIIDFLDMLPTLMIIIVIVSLIPKYNVLTFVLIMSAFSWTSIARLIRAKTLQQSSLDYVSASKTLGTPNFVIMFREVFPNIISIVVVNLTLRLAANMGLETGLTFLGFGLPFNTPSLGTLISYAAVPENMQNRPWQWLPAALLIVVMMLCINFVGNAVRRAADAKQRVA
ncbi:MAG: ABC transmembrane type-1 domain-containing protein [Lachnoclostridium sp.]|jgi:peptide/nickel transport system permease protein